MKKMIKDLCDNFRNFLHSIDMRLLIFTSCAGALAYMPCSILYGQTRGKIPLPTIAGLEIAVLAFTVAVSTYIYSAVSGRYVANKKYKNGVVTVFLLVVTLVLGCLFQYIYNLNFSAPKEPSSILFLLDDSGSMASNDSGYIRYKAVRKAVKSLNSSTNVAVMSYSGKGITMIQPFVPASSVDTFEICESNGNTPMRHGLEDALDYIRRNKEKCGDEPVLCLLSDGHPTDFGFLNPVGRILKSFRHSKIRINTVGLGSSADNRLLKEMAQKTKGYFVEAADALDLQNSILDASLNSPDRYLYMFRPYTKYDLLYSMERILFIFMLSLLTSSIVFWTYSREEASKMILVSSLITAAVAGMFLEIGQNVFYMNDMVSGIICWAMIGASFVPAVRPVTTFNLAYLMPKRKISERKQLRPGFEYGTTSHYDSNFEFDNITFE